MGGGGKWGPKGYLTRNLPKGTPLLLKILERFRKKLVKNAKILAKIGEISRFLFKKNRYFNFF
jgi:hypothetical protein